MNQKNKKNQSDWNANRTNLNPKRQTSLRLFESMEKPEKSETLKLKKYMICHNSELIDLAMYKPKQLR